jgi:hypothetical protein
MSYSFYLFVLDILHKVSIAHLQMLDCAKRVLDTSLYLGNGHDVWAVVFFASLLSGISFSKT